MARRPFRNLLQKEIIMSCENIPSISDLEKTKLRVDHFGELIDGTPSGTSVNPVTGLMLTDLPTTLKNVGFKPASFTFVTGGILNPSDYDKAVYNPAPNGDDNWYAWGGAMPKTIPANSTPQTTGGFGKDAWLPKTDNVLRLLSLEALRRSYSEAGYPFVIGSFEKGGSVVTANQSLLFETDGKGYSWAGSLPKTVPEGSTPQTTGGIGAGVWVDKSHENGANVASFSTVADMKAGVGPITPQMLDARDHQAITNRYYSDSPLGGAHYRLTTIARAQAENPGWVPDGLGSHYLFGGVMYVAVISITPTMTFTQFGAKKGGAKILTASGDAMSVATIESIKIDANGIYSFDSAALKSYVPAAKSNTAFDNVACINAALSSGATCLDGEGQSYMTTGSCYYRDYQQIRNAHVFIGYTTGAFPSVFKRAPSIEYCSSPSFTGLYIEGGARYFSYSEIEAARLASTQRDNYGSCIDLDGVLSPEVVSCHTFFGHYGVACKMTVAGNIKNNIVGLSFDDGITISSASSEYLGSKNSYLTSLTRNICVLSGFGASGSTGFEIDDTIGLADVSFNIAAGNASAGFDFHYHIGTLPSQKAALISFENNVAIANNLSDTFRPLDSAQNDSCGFRITPSYGLEFSSFKGNASYGQHNHDYAIFPSNVGQEEVKEFSIKDCVSVSSDLTKLSFYTLKSCINSRFNSTIMVTGGSYDAKGAHKGVVTNNNMGLIMRDVELIGCSRFIDATSGTFAGATLLSTVEFTNVRCRNHQPGAGNLTPVRLIGYYNYEIQGGSYETRNNTTTSMINILAHANTRFVRVLNVLLHSPIGKFAVTGVNVEPAAFVAIGGVISSFITTLAAVSNAATLTNYGNVKDNTTNEIIRF